MVGVDFIIVKNSEVSFIVNHFLMLIIDWIYVVIYYLSNSRNEESITMSKLLSFVLLATVTISA